MEGRQKDSSQLHKDVLSAVRECYSAETIIEEEPIKLTNKVLFLDIYIPRLKMAFECDGEQHFKYSKFFHGNAINFANQRKNDKEKEDFCNINRITLVRIRYDDKVSKDLIYSKALEALKK